MPIETADLRIIECLKESPRAANRTIARDAKLSEANVATRIASLEARGILSVMAVVDMRTVGYEDVVVVGVRVGDRHPDDVAAELTAMPEVMGLSSTFGRYQLVCFILARDKHHLGELLDQMGAIDGAQDLEACLVLDVLQMLVDVGKVSSFDRQAAWELPPGHSELDELDLGVIETLQENGRMSFREIGRRLSTPEATIRSRLARLEQTGAMKIVAVTDRTSLSADRATAWIALRVRGGALYRIAQELCDVADTRLVFTTIGRFNLVAIVHRSSRHELLDFVSKKVAPMQGVQQLEVWENVHVYKHDIRVSRL
jgi:DNA-binding Lrp family transcriptional regulator